MKDKNKVKAGKIGSSSRWFNHVKIKTKLIKVHEYDYDLISELSSVHGSFASVVGAAMRAYCRSRGIKYSPPSWVD